MSRLTQRQRRERAAYIASLQVPTMTAEQIRVALECERRLLVGKIGKLRKRYDEITAVLGQPA